MRSRKVILEVTEYRKGNGTSRIVRELGEYEEVGDQDIDYENILCQKKSVRSSGGAIGRGSIPLDKITDFDRRVYWEWLRELYPEMREE